MELIKEFTDEQKQVFHEIASEILHYDPQRPTTYKHLSDKTVDFCKSYYNINKVRVAVSGIIEDCYAACYFSNSENEDFIALRDEYYNDKAIDAFYLFMQFVTIVHEMTHKYDYQNRITTNFDANKKYNNFVVLCYPKLWYNFTGIHAKSFSHFCNLTYSQTELEKLAREAEYQMGELLFKEANKIYNQEKNTVCFADKRLMKNNLRQMDFLLSDLIKREKGYNFCKLLKPIDKRVINDIYNAIARDLDYFIEEFEDDEDLSPDWIENFSYWTNYLQLDGYPNDYDFKMLEKFLKNPKITNNPIALCSLHCIGKCHPTENNIRRNIKKIIEFAKTKFEYEDITSQMVKEFYYNFDPNYIKKIYQEELTKYWQNIDNKKISTKSVHIPTTVLKEQPICKNNISIKKQEESLLKE